MAFAPIPPHPQPSPSKRPYPQEWQQQGYSATQGEWAPPKKEARPQGWEEYDLKPLGVDEPQWGYTAKPPENVDPQVPSVKNVYPARPEDGYRTQPPVEGYSSRPVAANYPPKVPSQNDYYSYYAPRPQGTEGYPQRPPGAESYQPRQATIEGYSTWPPSDYYPHWPPSSEGYPPRPYPQVEYPPRAPPGHEYPPRAPPREDYPPRALPTRDFLSRGPPSEAYIPGSHPRENFPRRYPPRDDYPPRGPPKEDYPPREDYQPRGPRREDYPPRGPLREDYPSRGPPREDYPPRGPLREDYPMDPPRDYYLERPFWDECADLRSNRGHKWEKSDQRRSNEARSDWDQFEKPRRDDDSRGHGSFDRGRGNWGRGHSDRGRDSGDRGGGRDGRGRGHFDERRGGDHDKFSHHRDEESYEKRPHRKDDESDRGLGRDGRGRDRGSFRGSRGSFSNDSDKRYGKGRGRFYKGDDSKDLDLENMSLADKIERLSAFLKSDKLFTENPISVIKNSIGHTKVGLETEFESESICVSKSATPMYTGTLKIGGLFMSRGLKPNNKELKKEVHEKALDILKTLTVSEIFELTDPGKDSAIEQMENQFKKELKKFDEDLTEEEKRRNNKQDDAEMHGYLTAVVNALLTMKNVPKSAVGAIEQAVSQSCTLVTHTFQADAVKMSNGLLFFRGRLSIGTVVVGRGGDITKKKCKLETYNNALERLRTLSVDELMESVVDNQTIPDIRCTGESDENPTLSRLQALSSALKTRRVQANNVVQLDVATMLKGLPPIIVYKQVGEEDEIERILCELFLDKIFITSCEGATKHEAMVKTYRKAWDFLLEANIEDICANNRRISEEEIKDPKLLDVVIKGNERSLESNTVNLRNFGYLISEREKLDLKDLVIVEHTAWANDRKFNAFSILLYSCNQNGMILQWESFTVGKYFRFKIYVQRQVLGDSYGPRRNATKNLAAMDALFKLYETQDVLRTVSRPDDAEKWIPWSSFQAEANTLRDEYVDDEPPILVDANGNPLPDKFLMKALRNRVEKFVGTKDKGEDELIIGPGISGPELQELKHIVASLNLVCDSFRVDGELSLLIYEKLPLKKIVEVLKGRNRPFGRFVLVDREELPKHADIALFLIKKLPKDAEKEEVSKKSDNVEKMAEDLEKVDSLVKLEESETSVKQVDIKGTERSDEIVE